MTNKSKFIVASIGLLTGMLGMGIAQAGSYGGQVVKVYTSTRHASGSVGAARRSSNPVERIGCTVTADVAGESGRCYAANAANTYAACDVGMNSPEMIDAMRSISPASHIEFWWNSSGLCTTIAVTNSSEFLN